ncbi:nucleotidyltransferase domain-containing protein [Patescibacteria group bacterium]|nr:nucleotidyltransferase domain-containing protein [Patescibacteria group bacterium]MBU4512095.1 nucleotidyltransferase domain-containing protein [Patescibacteria group bacterium]MCG2693420.1 nucleotidyltransferase domain-containing protein [Candidatus Parcubacteria bacterium]
MLNFLKNTKGEILNLFFKDPDKEYYLREIARNLGKEPGHFQAALNTLVKEGILKDERKGNLRFFRLNKDHPLYEEIKKIISKTIGIEAKIKALVDKFKKVEYAFIFGSIARGKEYGESDIDLMLIGQVDQNDLVEKANELEGELKREINYQIYSGREAADKLKEGNDFFVRIFNEPKIILKGNLNEFTEIIKRGKNRKD